MENIKKCGGKNSCGQEKPLGEFNRDKNTKDGFNYTCRECVNNDRREKNKKKKLEKLSKIPVGTKKCSFCKEYIAFDLFGKCSSHKDGLASQCKPCKKIKDKEYHENNKERITKQRKKYRENNKEKISVAGKKYGENNKEKISIKNKQYYLDNKECIIKKNLEYSRERYKSDINYRLTINLRGRLYSALNGNFKNGSAVRDLGCSIVELKKYLELKFQPGMTWDNWTIDGWHIDHIKPLASFDLTNRKQILKACHYTNLQPLWAKDNLSKGARII